MKNPFAMAALVIGLAFGSSSASFAGNVDGGAHPRSGVPTVGEQGANTARGISRDDTPHSRKTGNYRKNRHYGHSRGRHYGHSRGRHYGHYGHRHYRPQYRGYGYTPQYYGGGYGGPYYGGRGYGYGGPSVTFGFGGGGYVGKTKARSDAGFSLSRWHARLKRRMCKCAMKIASFLPRSKFPL